MAASLRAAATRMLRPAVLPGEGLRRLVHIQQLSKSTLALEEEHRASLIQQKKEQLCFQLSKSTFALEDEHRASLIQQKKEQLYELIADADADSVTSSLDRSLLKDLSTQVKPRPQDPQWRKITRTKMVTKWTASVGILVTSALTYCGLASRPEIVKYDGYLVTAESLPILQGYQPAATAEGVNKQDGYQPVATGEGVHKQEEMQKQRG